MMIYPVDALWTLFYASATLEGPSNVFVFCEQKKPSVMFGVHCCFILRSIYVFRLTSSMYMYNL